MNYPRVNLLGNILNIHTLIFYISRESNQFHPSDSWICTSLRIDLQWITMILSGNSLICIRLKKASWLLLKISWRLGRQGRQSEKQFLAQWSKVLRIIYMSCRFVHVLVRVGGRQSETKERNQEQRWFNTVSITLTLWPRGSMFDLIRETSHTPFISPSIISRQMCLICTPKKKKETKRELINECSNALVCLGSPNHFIKLKQFSLLNYRYTGLEFPFFFPF